MMHLKFRQNQIELCATPMHENWPAGPALGNKGFARTLVIGARLITTMKATALVIKGSMTQTNIFTDHCLNLRPVSPLSNLFIDQCPNVINS